MPTLTPFFDHSRHKLDVRNVDVPLEVLAFQGEECLSQPFSYVIEFTSTELDIAAELLLGRDARFSLYGRPPGPALPGLSWPQVKPLRTVHGVVTACPAPSPRTTTEPCTPP